jgi:PKHD-type hydroxylase
MLTVIEDLLSKQEVAKFTQSLDKGQWIDGKHTAGSQASKVKYNQQLDDSSALATELRNVVIRKLSANALFMSSALPNKIYPPKFNRYQGGEHYGLHVDSSVMPIPNSHQMLRTDLSATLFLSEPSTYDGGELSIETQFGLQQIKLNAGSVILYPANSLHQVNPVTKGHRTASFFWVESLVRSNDQRSMLFDLDQSIQALTVELGSNDAEVKRLTGVYHNLMRSWANC